MEPIQITPTTNTSLICHHHLTKNGLTKNPNNCNLYKFTNGPTKPDPILHNRITLNGIHFQQVNCPQFTYELGHNKPTLYLSTHQNQLEKYAIIVPKELDQQLHQAIQQFNTQIANHPPPILTV